MPIPSLPGPYGVGTLGAAARAFVDFLRAAGQNIWQILPIGPTGFGDSPYQSFSSFAGNPYLIDLDALAAEGLLEPGEYRDLNWGDAPQAVDYGLLYRQRAGVLRHACRRLLAHAPADYGAFVEENAFWLEDYALFTALKERFGGASWRDWPEDLRRRTPEGLAVAREKLSDGLDEARACQYLFFRQWDKLKAYANGCGVSILGDLPIYVAEDSAEVWTDPGQFQLSADLEPTEVAGCPPDGFSADGQVWGNPLFDWEKMKGDGYRWWLRRMDYQFRIYDVLRIDHFRGFDAYFAIPAGDTTARSGRWRPGPGLDFLQAVKEALGERPIIAEDLGFLTPSVRKLLRDTGFPGMKVLQFAFDSRDGSGAVYLPDRWPEHCVAYVGTHDNSTVLGWKQSAPPADTACAQEFLDLTDEEGWNWGMMRALWASAADRAVVQMQDLLGMDDSARMNTPSTLGGNWRWRALPGDFTPGLAERIRREMERCHRLPR